MEEKCSCCDKDENENYLYEPCCYNSGVCQSDAIDKKETIGNCIHCGGEMFKENGLWFHHEQKEIPFEERFVVHYGI